VCMYIFSLEAGPPVLLHSIFYFLCVVVFSSVIFLLRVRVCVGVVGCVSVGGGRPRSYTCPPRSRRGRRRIV
jgi:hypothetical protein